VLDHFAYDLLWAGIEQMTGLKQAQIASGAAAHLLPLALATPIVVAVYWTGRRQSANRNRVGGIDLSNPSTVPISLAHFISLEVVAKVASASGLKAVRSLRQFVALFRACQRFLFYFIPGLNYEVPYPAPSRDRRAFNQMIQQSTFFANRFADAFPALRLPETFAGRYEIAARLRILMRYPLAAAVADGFNQRTVSPIWWTRGHSNMHIERWCRFKPGVFLMNEHELAISRIHVIPGRAYWQKFVYVECVGQSSIGLRRIPEQDIAAAVEAQGFCDEEYSLYNFRAYTVAEDDDGGYVRGGRVRRFSHVRDRRVRYLTKFNFLIVHGTSPALANEVDQELERRLDVCLQDDTTLGDLANWLLRLPKNPATELAERI
jgi:hypothetical protein